MTWRVAVKAGWAAERFCIFVLFEELLSFGTAERNCYRGKHARSHIDRQCLRCLAGWLPFRHDASRVGCLFHTGGVALHELLRSLKKLSDLNNGTATDVLWTDLKKQLTDALKQESDVDFIRPAILAVLRLCEALRTSPGRRQRRFLRSTS